MAASISDSLYCEAAAREKHLPDIVERVRSQPDKTISRRPNAYDIEVYSFPQSWGSTALGFGGVGGQAITTAQTTVVISSPGAAVYFGRRLAYVIQNVNVRFGKDLASFNMAEVRQRFKYEGS